MRIADPIVAGRFYDFTAEITAPREHQIRFYTRDANIYFTTTVTSVTEDTVTLFAPISMIPTEYGNGDYFEIYRRENSGVYTLIIRADVDTYKSVSDTPYVISVGVPSTSGISRDLFLVKIHSMRLPDGYYTMDSPVYERVVREDEITKYKTINTLSLSAAKSGYQWYRDRVFFGGYDTEDTADAAVASIIAQLQGLVIRLATPSVLYPAFTPIPAAGTIQIGESLALSATGANGDVSWSFTQNQTGGTLSVSGVYTAGPTAGIDILKGLDTANNNVSVILTVVDTYSYYYTGEFTWLVS